MLHGSWVWNSESKALTYIKPESDGESPGEEKSEVSESKTTGEETTWEHGKNRRPKEGSVINITDVKDVVLEFLKREIKVPKMFHLFVSLPLIDDLIMWTLRYFNYYFELRSRKLFVTGIQAVENLLGREYTLQEVQVLTTTCLRCLGQVYCNLLLGVDSSRFHHLKGGKSYLSSTLVDRKLYEVFYKFLTDVVWFIFGKKEQEVIRYEVNRLFRSDEFNPFDPPPLASGVTEHKGNVNKLYKRSPLVEVVLSSLGTDPASGLYKPVSHVASTKFERDLQLPSSIGELKAYVEQELEYVGILGKNRDDYDSDLELITD